MKELELYDRAETGVLELWEKELREVNRGFSLWRRRKEGSRFSAIMTGSRRSQSTPLAHSRKCMSLSQDRENNCRTRREIGGD